jgi:ankyrin repeat protein
LLNVGANIRIATDIGQTPLLLAASNGHEALVRMLLGQNDIGPNFRDKFGQTPLSWAASNGRRAVMNLLQ